jgi:hypothetical protein
MPALLLYVIVNGKIPRGRDMPVRNALASQQMIAEEERNF